MIQKIKVLFAFFLFEGYSGFSQTFSEVSLLSGVEHSHNQPSLIGGGVAFFDYDNDSLPDIYLTGGNNRDKLYHNIGNGQFLELGIAAGLGGTAAINTTGVTTGDYDNDGDRDVFITTWGDAGQMGFGNILPNLLFRNNGNGTFTDVSHSAGIRESAWSVSASFGDYNKDGWLDIFVSNYIRVPGFIRDSFGEVIGFSHLGFPNFLYRNNRNGTFTEVAGQLGVADNGTTLAATFTDYDNDNDMDIYVANDFGEWVKPNALYRNNYPADSFTDMSAISNADIAIYGMGIATGDYDEDGDLDYYTTNIGRNVLLNNSGTGIFQDVTDSAGVANTYVDTLFATSWGTAFLDYDNNTYLDLFVAHGHIPAVDFIANAEKDPNKLFRNNADGTFSNVSYIEGVDDSSVSRGFAYGDYDNDGDLDMVVVVLDFDSMANEHTLLYRNNVSNGNHWLKIQLQGTQSNRDGYGSHVRIVAGGRNFVREIDGGSSHASHHSSLAHFGLGSYTSVDSIIVTWTYGNQDILTNVNSNQLLVITETRTLPVFTNLQISICDDDSIFVGGSYQTVTGSYADTFQASAGVDSIVITQLTVLADKTTNLNIGICLGDSIYAGGSFQSIPGIYFDTLSALNGCDSIVITHLVLFNADFISVSISICDSDSAYAGGGFQNTPGLYYDTLTNSNGCDSLVETGLSVLAKSFSNETVSICSTDSFYAGGEFQNTTGIYFDTLSSFSGCDSIIETSLLVVSTNITPLHFNLCDGDRFFAGGTYQTISGIYFDTLISSSGCDSVIESDISFSPDHLVMILDTIAFGDSIFAGGSYQFFSGTYVDSFISTEGCDSIVITELEVLLATNIYTRNQENLYIFPNPVNSLLNIHYTLESYGYNSLKVITHLGKEIVTLVNSAQLPGEYLLKYETKTLSTGTYFVKFQNENEIRVVKFAVIK